MLLAGLIAALISIRVDQAGYPSHAPKIGVVVAEPPASSFSIGSIRGALSEPVLDPDSGDFVQWADFSRLSTPGTYELRIDDAAGTPVVISADPYGPVLQSATRAFYGQRCGMAVDLGGGYTHGLCHREGAFHPSSGRSGTATSTAGWHDAGDYGRYVVNSGISTATLLWAAELFDLEILEEIRWNLNWMLTMQDEDGGVFHKQTSLQFPPLVLRAEDDRSTSYVIGKGSCATANFAAVMAMAARHDQRYLAPAKKAWAWLARHPDVTFTNPSDVVTGEYGDKDCRDERQWAAAEIWRATGDASARDYFVSNADEAIGAIRSDSPPSWNDLGAFGAWRWALHAPAGDRTRRAIVARTLATADAIVQRSARHPYRIPLVTDDYVWGSNAVAANYALHLLIANELRPDRRYVNAALDVVHYLLGRNNHALSFVTGVGSRSVMHPHHRPSEADGIDAPWPGLLAGGPNKGRQDEVLKELPVSTPPAKSYVDDARSYASNEIAINWNAPLVFVIAGCRQQGGR